MHPAAAQFSITLCTSNRLASNQDLGYGICIAQAQTRIENRVKMGGNEAQVPDVPSSLLGWSRVPHPFLSQRVYSEIVKHDRIAKWWRAVLLLSI